MAVDDVGGGQVQGEGMGGAEVVFADFAELQAGTDEVQAAGVGKMIGAAVQVTAVDQFHRGVGPIYN